MAAAPELTVPGEGKLETNITLRLVEAKNLIPPELKHSRDTYVITALDQEEIFRTATIDKSLSPLFNEEYSFRVPRNFSKLTFYLCEPGLHKDSRLGKVSVLHDELQAKPTREEQWYPLQHIDADSEVQGKIHLSLDVEEIEVVEGESKQTQYMLTVKVLEADDLSEWPSATCPDPYCQVTILPNTPAAKCEVRRGSARKRTSNPLFQDTFSFPFRDLKQLLNAIIRVSLWHDPLIGEKVFLGQVNLAIGTFRSPRWSHSGWYWLCPRPATQAQAGRPEIGSLRLKILYSNDVIYPLKVYDTLSQMLLGSVLCSVRDLHNTAVFILGEVHRDWSAVGCSLTRIFLALNKLEALIQKLIQHEVEGISDPNTLFRGNSLASKVIDEFMKLAGCSYLQRTLQGCIDEIFDVRRQCEIDPSRLMETDIRDVNMANLLFFVEKILSAILASARSCPQMMCRVFAMLKEAAVAKFPDKRDVVCYTSVSGFIFLRFFAPAILNPRLFHLRPECPNSVVARTLTLISKSIQSLGNIGGPKLSSSLQHKETFMTQLQMELSDHTDDVKAYLTAISDARGGEQCSLTDMVYREGMLTKRSQGRRKGPKNFRRRFFCLSSESLTYSKAKGEVPLCTIPSPEMLAVERVDESAFGLKFMFQLVQPERILYMQARNSVEELEWLTALSKACAENSSQSFFHSGTYTNTSWTCCGNSSVEVSTGCKPISLAIKMLARREDIDLARELHKVYKMFCLNQAKLIAMKDKATLTAREDHHKPLPPRLTTLCELIVYVKNLELASNSYMQSVAQKLSPGSKNEPHRCSSGEALVIS